MANARARSGFPFTEFLYLGTTMVGSVMLMRYFANIMDPTAQARKQVTKKAKDLEKRLGHRLGNVTQHELMAVDLVVDPADIDTDLNDIGGLDDILERLVTQMQGPLTHPEIYNGGLLAHPKGILLYGPPGTGKTMIAKALAKQCQAFFLVVQPSAVQSKWYGETNKAITGIFKLARRLSQGESACVIFIDEVDALLGKRKDHEHEVSIGMKTEFMSLWDGMDTDLTSKVVIMGATNRPQELDAAVLRRFTLSIAVELPDTAAREDIIMTHLRQHCEQHVLGADAVDVDLMQNEAMPDLESKRPAQWLAEQTNGYSGADLHELATEAARNSVLSMTSALATLRQQGQRRQQQAAPTQAREQRPLSIADFQAALRVYTPTQQKAESFQRPNVDPLAAMASMWANLSSNDLANGQGLPNGSHDDNSESNNANHGGN
ncbi:hypothetical protein WJX79_011011 [Trebouxia sp. C0005]